jgi:hypothetical protein
MEKEEFEIEKIIPMNIIKDQKQMRVAIPSEIIEEFGIDPDRHQFGWIIEKAKDKNLVVITGKFLIKQNEKGNQINGNRE